MGCSSCRGRRTQQRIVQVKAPKPSVTTGSSPSADALAQGHNLRKKLRFHGR